MKCYIYIELRKDILDPEGKAMLHALHALQFSEVHQVRVSKMIELELNETTQAQAQKRVEQMCKELLANPIIENYRIEWPA